MSQPNLVGVIQRCRKEEARTFLLSADIKKSQVHQYRLSERKSSTSGKSHRPVIFPFFKRSIQIVKPIVAHWGLRKSRLVPEEPSHQVTQAWKQYTAMRTNSLMPAHSQAAQPYSNKHVIQNFLEPPPTSKIVPTYCTKQLREGGQRAATQFCCGLGITERGASRRTWKRNMRQSCPSYLGSSLSATPLCI